MTLPDPSKIAPLKASTVSAAGDGWLVAYQTGASEDGEDWCILTDNVRASALMSCELPADARDDAEAIAAIINAYRTGALVPAPLPLFQGAVQ